jgi:hypothetical protein
LFALLVAAVFASLGPAPLRHAMFSVDGRIRKAQRHVVGPFSGASVVGVRDIGTRSLLAVADDVKRGLLDALGHQRTRLDQVLELVEPHTYSRAALGALVIDHRPDVGALRLGESTTATAHRIDWASAGASLPRSLALGLEFAFAAEGPVIRCSLAYNPSRFSEQRAQALVDRTADLLGQASDGTEEM